MVFFILMLTSVLVVPAYAQSSQPGDVTTPTGGRHIGGIVPPHGQMKPVPETITYLSYHGGPVMHTNRTFAIYWVPAGYAISANYMPVINRFFTDVAADSWHTSNVYYSDTQYYGPGAVHIADYSSFGGAYLDTNPFPANGCALYDGLAKCLSDAQIQTEIKRVIALKGWGANASTMFFMFTPRNVGSCAGTDCAFTKYCAYHGSTGNVIYANQPYTYTKPADCGIGYATSTPPNGFPVDSTISVISHEHNEAITDPQLNAWWDNTNSDENGDKCAWNFGTLTAGSYNQTINTHHYVVQQEWSNFSSGCVLVGK